MLGDQEHVLSTRKSSFGAILASLHTALIVYAVYAAGVTPPQRSVAWSILEVADWPIIMAVRFFARSGDASFAPSGFFVLGNVQWFVIGFALQALARRLAVVTRRTPNNARGRVKTPARPCE